MLFIKRGCNNVNILETNHAAYMIKLALQFNDNLLNTDQAEIARQLYATNRNILMSANADPKIEPVFECESSDDDSSQPQSVSPSNRANATCVTSPPQNRSNNANNTCGTIPSNTSRCIPPSPSTSQRATTPCRVSPKRSPEQNNLYKVVKRVKEDLGKLTPEQQKTFCESINNSNLSNTVCPKHTTVCGASAQSPESEGSVLEKTIELISEQFIALTPEQQHKVVDEIETGGQDDEECELENEEEELIDSIKDTTVCCEKGGSPQDEEVCDLDDGKDDGCNMNLAETLIIEQDDENECDELLNEQTEDVCKPTVTPCGTQQLNKGNRAQAIIQEILQVVRDQPIGSCCMPTQRKSPSKKPPRRHERTIC